MTKIGSCEVKIMEKEKDIEKVEKKKKMREKHKGLWADFKAFITRGNILDMAVGVIIGGAFSAIVAAFVNILLSVCTWGVPGGLSGLVTVLPSLNESQKAPEGYANVVTASEYLKLPSTTQAIYVQHGANYYYKGLAIIDWGTLINVCISFIIIAITLFIIVQSAKAVGKKKEEFEKKAVEAYYQKHPEMRPVKVVEEKKATELDILTEIRDMMAKQNEIKERKN